MVSPPCTVALPGVQAVGSQPMPSGARAAADTHGHIVTFFFFYFIFRRFSSSDKVFMLLL